MVEKQNLRNKITKNSHLKKILERHGSSEKSDEKAGINIKKDDIDDERVQDLQKKVLDLQEKNEKLYNDLLMSVADKENLKKTMERELQSARDYSISKLAEKVVNSLDSLEKAIESANSLNLDKNIKNIVEGVDMTLKSVVSALQDDGVEKILPSMGDKFDHNFHQAIQTINDDACENNTIKDVLQCGYKIKNRLLRAAMVVVSTRNG